jgi:L,D-peptidoglycan transpeptidase YkuD (ErfK/YbiS/YcfS/YnhG family)
MMDILVFPDRTVEWNGERFACALGPAGVTAAKREGDGATPAGCFPLRRVFYRADRIAAPCAPGRKPWEAVSMGHY